MSLEMQQNATLRSFFTHFDAATICQSDDDAIQVEISLSVRMTTLERVECVASSFAHRKTSSELNIYLHKPPLIPQQFRVLYLPKQNGVEPRDLNNENDFSSFGLERLECCLFKG